jgi:rhodanese-related sulfurtransferase
MAVRIRPRHVVMGALLGAILAMAVVWLLESAPAHLKPWTLDPADPAVSLSDVEQEVIRRYATRDITPASLAQKLDAGEVVLFDVRTEEEFASGHLPGAIRVDPQTRAEDFLARFGDVLPDKMVVFYCAVGVRSSQLLVRLTDEVARRAPRGAYNLRGGTFRWSAEGRRLVAGDQPGQPHPFDKNWGKLLERTLKNP